MNRSPVIRGVAGCLLVLVALCGPAGLPLRAVAQQAGPSSAEVRVAEAFCGKQVVVLGELPSHGEGRAFQAKARIVELLVDRCGFDALFFEAPVYEFLGLQQALAEGRAEPLQLDKAIGGFWWTSGLGGWRRRLFDRAVEGRLVLGGLDDQPSATLDYSRATLPGLVAAALPPEQAPECRQAVERTLYWRYGAGQEYDEQERIRLERCARLAADAMAAEEGTDGGTPERVMVENLAGYFGRQRGSPEAPDRDAVMYHNFRWQLGRMSEGGKAVVWTATVHAARGPIEGRAAPLGARLAEAWGDRLAVVGFSAFAGASSRAGSPSKPLPEAPPGSLEARATGADTAWVYLDAAALREIGDVPARLFGRFGSADWSAYFDGVLVIREEVAPVFEKWR